MTRIITWVFFVWVLYKLYRVLNRGGRSFLEWLQDRTYRKANERRQKWQAKIQADPVARRMILEDADWLNSTR